MEDQNLYEYVTSPKKQTSFRVKRLLMILGYVVYDAALLIIGLATPLFVPMMALIPLSTWILVWFTWRYVSIEYEYSFAGGMMILSYVYGGKSRKKIAEIRIKDMTMIAPFEGDYVKEAEKYAPERTLDFTSDLQRDDVYQSLESLINGWNP